MTPPKFSMKKEQAIAKLSINSVYIPASIFDDSLSPFETIAKYLRENKQMRFSEIAKLTNRDQRAINMTYRAAIRKMKQQLEVKLTEYKVPLEVLTNKELSVSENIIIYLKDTYALKYSEIAQLMRRDDRTVWTIYNRGKKKIKPEELVHEIIFVPATIFNEVLSPFETIAKYLRENKQMRFSEIAKLTNRDQRAINMTYRAAIRKMKQQLEVKLTEYKVPLEVLTNKELSVSENIIIYLKDTYALKYSEIAQLMRRDDRTVWTIYNRAKNKKK